MGNPYQDLNPPHHAAFIDGRDDGTSALDPAPFPVRADGRGLMVCEAWVNEDGTCRLRLDDNLRPMFWAEIHLDLEFVKRWFALAEAAKSARAQARAKNEGV